VEGHNKKFFRRFGPDRCSPLFVPAPLQTVLIDRRLNSVGLLFCDL